MEIVLLVVLCENVERAGAARRRGNQDQMNTGTYGMTQISPHDIKALHNISKPDARGFTFILCSIVTTNGRRANVWIESESLDASCKKHSTRLKHATKTGVWDKLSTRASKFKPENTKGLYVALKISEDLRDTQDDRVVLTDAQAVVLTDAQAVVRPDAQAVVLTDAQAVVLPDDRTHLQVAQEVFCTSIEADIPQVFRQDVRSFGPVDPEFELLAECQSLLTGIEGRVRRLEETPPRSVVIREELYDELMMMANSCSTSPFDKMNDRNEEPSL